MAAISLASIFSTLTLIILFHLLPSQRLLGLFLFTKAAFRTEKKNNSESDAMNKKAEKRPDSSNNGFGQLAQPEENKFKGSQTLADDQTSKRECKAATKSNDAAELLPLIQSSQPPSNGKSESSISNSSLETYLHAFYQ